MKKLSLAFVGILVAAIPVAAQEHEHSAPAPQTQAPQQAPMSGGMMMHDKMQGMKMNPAPQAQAPQRAPMRGGMTMRGNVQGMQMGPMLGEQTIPVTITAIEAATGLVSVTTGQQIFDLPFSRAALKGVKVGDRVTIHIEVHKP